MTQRLNKRAFLAVAAVGIALIAGTSQAEVLMDHVFGKGKTPTAPLTSGWEGTGPVPDGCLRDRCRMEHCEPARVAPT